MSGLHRSAGFGPYFAVAEERHGPGWRPWAALVDGPAAADRVRRTRAALTDPAGAPAEVRACASITFLGLAVQVVSPALGAAALDAAVPTPGAIWWRPAGSGPLDVAWTDVRTDATASAEDAARALVDGVITTAVAPLADTFGRVFALSPKVLWGNVASAIGGAAAAIAAAAVPGALEPFDIARAALDRGPLRGAARYVEGGRRPVLARHNCCLYYRLPGGARCADCVLVHSRAGSAARRIA